MNLYDKLHSKNLLNCPPAFLKNNVHYLCQMGSVAYGCSTDHSDIDVYGWAIPPKDIIFPHTAGYIHGFDKNIPAFNQYQLHHIKDNDKEYDLTIYSIISYFRLIANCNPNMIDSLFVPHRCILHSTKTAELIRENRHLFLSLKAWHTFKGYSYSQLNKCKNKAVNEWVRYCNLQEFDYYISKEELISKVGIDSPGLALLSRVDNHNPRSKRILTIAKYGYDVKFAYHIVRLLNEVEQIMQEHDIDLERNREQLKSIRRGDWTLLEVEEYFTAKELELEKLYSTSTLRRNIATDEIRELLFNCLEEHFGSLDAIITKNNSQTILLRQIAELANRGVAKRQ